MEDIYRSLGITASCGIGTNLYLAKVALDITAKHATDHIGELDEESYRRTLWDHKPLTDFWRVGEGLSGRLRLIGITTMGGIASADEDMLYKLLGVDAELLIDHAWGRETTLLSDIKNYKAKTNSISSGQVLGCDCDYEGGKLIVKEMVDLLSLDLVSKGLVTDSLTLHISYNKLFEQKSAHGTAKVNTPTSSSKRLVECAASLYDKIIDRHVPIRRFSVTFNHVVVEAYQQYDLFTDPEETEREYQLQKAVLDIKDKFGKNAVLKGMNLQEGATTRERNLQIGGHRSGD